ncbi:MAG: hypothetical protein ACKPAH_08145, partial [Verrucomicrobiota bacterium]
MSDAFIPCFAGGWMASFSFQAPHSRRADATGAFAPGLVSIDPTACRGTRQAITVTRDHAETDRTVIADPNSINRAR